MITFGMLQYDNEQNVVTHGMEVKLATFTYKLKTQKDTKAFPTYSLFSVCRFKNFLELQDDTS